MLKSNNSYEFYCGMGAISKNQICSLYNINQILVTVFVEWTEYIKAALFNLPLAMKHSHWFWCGLSSDISQNHGIKPKLKH